MAVKSTNFIICLWIFGLLVKNGAVTPIPAKEETSANLTDVKVPSSPKQSKLTPQQMGFQTPLGALQLILGEVVRLLSEAGTEVLNERIGPEVGEYLELAGDRLDSAGDRVDSFFESKKPTPEDIMAQQERVKEVGEVGKDIFCNFAYCNPNPVLGLPWEKPSNSTAVQVTQSSQGHSQANGAPDQGQYNEVNSQGVPTQQTNGGPIQGQYNELNSHEVPTQQTNWGGSTQGQFNGVPIKAQYNEVNSQDTYNEVPIEDQFNKVPAQEQTHVVSSQAYIDGVVSQGDNLIIS